MSKALHIGIIGGGPAGYVAALYAAAEGAQVTLVEQAGMGGTCLQRGCIPTKRLVAISHLLEKIQEAEKYGIELEGQAVPRWENIRTGVEKLVGGIEKGLHGLFDNRKITLIQSTATPIAAIKPLIQLDDGERIQVDRLLLCSGSKPHRPASFDFNDSTVCTSDELWHWDTLPESLMIVGEGVIASEFAFVFNAMGIDVTMLGMMDRPLPAMDQFISNIINREMKKKKIKFKGGKLVSSLEPGDGQWQAYNEQELLATADRVLVCTGRVPNTESLYLKKNNIKTDKRGAIIVDGYMQTNVEGIYAAGDVTGGVLLAHAASAQASVAIAHMLGLESHGHENGYDASAIPSAVFTTPEVASVGITEAQANEQGIEISIGSFDMRALGKAHAMGEIAGGVKLIANAKTRRLLGAHMVGANVTELIHEAAVVLTRQGLVDDIIRTVHAHPTLSEAVVEAAEDIFSQAPHKPLKKKREERNVHTA